MLITESLACFYTSGSCPVRNLKRVDIGVYPKTIKNRKSSIFLIEHPEPFDWILSFFFETIHVVKFKDLEL